MKLIQKLRQFLDFYRERKRKKKYIKILNKDLKIIAAAMKKNLRNYHITAAPME